MIAPLMHASHYQHIHSVLSIASSPTPLLFPVILSENNYLVIFLSICLYTYLILSSSTCVIKHSRYFRNVSASLQEYIEKYRVFLYSCHCSPYRFILFTPFFSVLYFKRRNPMFHIRTTVRFKRSISQIFPTSPDLRHCRSVEDLITRSSFSSE